MLYLPVPVLHWQRSFLKRVEPTKLTSCDSSGGDASWIEWNQ